MPATSSADDAWPPDFIQYPPIQLSTERVASIMKRFDYFCKKAQSSLSASSPDEKMQAWVEVARIPQIRRIMVNVNPAAFEVPKLGDLMLRCDLNYFRRLLVERRVVVDTSVASTASIAFTGRKELLQSLLPLEVHESLDHFLRTLDAPKDAEILTQITTETTRSPRTVRDTEDDIHTLAVADRTFLRVSSIYLCSNDKTRASQKAFESFDNSYREFRQQRITAASYRAGPSEDEATHHIQKDR